MRNDKQTYLIKRLHGLQERLRLPSVQGDDTEGDNDHARDHRPTTMTSTSRADEDGDQTQTLVTQATADDAAPPLPIQEKRIVLPDDIGDDAAAADDNGDDGGRPPPLSTTTNDFDEDAFEDEAVDLEDAFALVRKGLRRKPCNHKYVVESLAAIANLPLKKDALNHKETMLRRMPGFPIEQLQYDVERFFKFYANLVVSEDVDVGGDEGKKRGVSVLTEEMGKRVMLYQALSRELNGNTVDIEEGRLLMAMGAKSFVVALYAMMNEFEYRMYPDIFRMSPGVGVDASDAFDQYLSTAFQKGCALLDLQPDEIQLIQHDCISKNELSYLTSAKRYKR